MVHLPPTEGVPPLSHPQGPPPFTFHFTQNKKWRERWGFRVAFVFLVCEVLRLSSGFHFMFSTWWSILFLSPSCVLGSNFSFPLLPAICFFFFLENFGFLMHLVFAGFGFIISGVLWVSLVLTFHLISCKGSSRFGYLAQRVPCNVNFLDWEAVLRYWTDNGWVEK